MYFKQEDKTKQNSDQQPGVRIMEAEVSGSQNQRITQSKLITPKIQEICPKN